MRIRYIGKVQRRVVGRYVWERGNDYIQDVMEADIALDLLTSPESTFETVEEEEKDKLEEFITGQTNVPMKKTRQARKSKLAEGG